MILDADQDRCWLETTANGSPGDCGCGTIRGVTGTIELVSSDPSGRTPRPAWRWRCTCGESTGGRWYRSAEEALKAARRHTDRCEEESPVDVEASLQKLLDELCVVLGFCLPPHAQQRLRQTQPPFDLEEFTDAVFIAEGMDPQLNTTLRRAVRETVERRLVAIEERVDRRSG